MRVVAIYAHPDDMEINCGGTIKLHSIKGHEIYSLILTDGELGGAAEDRIKEAEKAAEILGVKETIFLHFRDGHVKVEPESIDIIRKYINDIKPDIIYTHYKEDYHQDHTNTYRLTISAARRSDVSILTTEGISTLRFRPLIYVDIKKTIKYKVESIRAHKSQLVRRSISLDRVTLMARIRGYESGLYFAEAFYPIRMIFLR